MRHPAVCDFWLLNLQFDTWRFVLLQCFLFLCESNTDSEQGSLVLERTQSVSSCPVQQWLFGTRAYAQLENLQCLRLIVAPGIQQPLSIARGLELRKLAHLKLCDARQAFLYLLEQLSLVARVFTCTGQS